MALKAASGCVVVSPSLVENGERENASGLIVVGEPSRKVYRGVLVHIGRAVEEEFHVGDVVHYSDYCEVGELHIVGARFLLAYEDDE